MFREPLVTARDFLDWTTAYKQGALNAEQEVFLYQAWIDSGLILCAPEGYQQKVQELYQQGKVGEPLRN